MHGGLSPELHHMDQVHPPFLPPSLPPSFPPSLPPSSIGVLHHHRTGHAKPVQMTPLPPSLPPSLPQIRRLPRPTDVPDTGLLCDLLWADPDKEIAGWGENERGVSFTFGEDIVQSFLKRHDLDLICRAHQVGPPSLPPSLPDLQLDVLTHPSLLPPLHPSLPSLNRWSKTATNSSHGGSSSPSSQRYVPSLPPSLPPSYPPSLPTSTTHPSLPPSLPPPSPPA